MTDPVYRDETPVPPNESLPRKSANPLVWLVVLLALLAAIWFFYNRSASTAAVESTATTPAIGADDQSAAAQAERDQADAAVVRKKASRERTARTEAPAPVLADRAAAPVAMIKPTYPTDALRAREEGIVTVRADIDASGTPNNVTVVHRSGSRDLDKAALDAVRQSHFNPAIQSGKAVASTVEVPVDFKLSEQ